ncbi:MAG: D-aminoacyl-tRNA deacylase [Lentimonas sp.]
MNSVFLGRQSWTFEYVYKKRLAIFGEETLLSSMRAVIQRVTHATVTVDGKAVGEIDSPNGGLLIFLGVGQSDTMEDVDWLVRRLVKLRIFEDADGRMNHSLIDVEGAAIVISQFTLFGSLKKGNRPSFNRAALPVLAVPIYEAFCDALSEVLGQKVARGRFGEQMKIDAANDGPVTLVVDTQNRDL